ncbi:hypothetical protein CHARACLAT_019171 [Characodon lateralis]|uniref:Uncharacterized protein n=1 Tax=Characodon lateralis TaxID=208331 RepID=A0ABU7EV16_9TELE|nr:hypothetical protein [Characodon lateralis]
MTPFTSIHQCPIRPPLTLGLRLGVWRKKHKESQILKGVMECGSGPCRCPGDRWPSLTGVFPSSCSNLLLSY